MTEKPLPKFTFVNEGGGSFFVAEGLSIICFDLLFYPNHQKIHNPRLLTFGQFCSERNLVPLVQATPATASASVLRNEDRVSAHWGLFTVVRNNCRSKPLPYKVSGMFTDNIQSFFSDVLLVLFCQMEFGTEGGPLQLS